MEYIVGVREVHVHFYKVTADNEHQAKQRVYDYDEEFVKDTHNIEYSHNRDSIFWSVEEVTSEP